MTTPGFTAAVALASATGHHHKSRNGTRHSQRGTEISPALVSCHVEFHQPAAGETCYWHEWTGGVCGYLTSCDFGL
jgi:hypothetical protein